MIKPSKHMASYTAVPFKAPQPYQEKQTSAGSADCNVCIYDPENVTPFCTQDANTVNRVLVATCTKGLTVIVKVS